MAEIGELEKKVWYRFFKLCYVFAYVMSVSVVVLIGYYDLPTEYVDSNRSMVRCANGKIFSVGLNSIYPSGSRLDHYEDEKARKLCADIFDSVGAKAPQNIVPQEDLPEGLRGMGQIQFVPDEQAKNYTFIPVKAIRGSYKTLFWGLVIVILLGEVIRRSFLYVVAGRPFFWGR